MLHGLLHQLEKRVARTKRQGEVVPSAATATSIQATDIRVHVVVAGHAQVVRSWSAKWHQWCWAARRWTMEATWTERVHRWTERVKARTRDGTHRWVTTVTKQRMVGSDQHVGVPTTSTTTSSQARRKHVPAANLMDARVPSARRLAYGRITNDRARA